MSSEENASVKLMGHTLRSEREDLSFRDEVYRIIGAAMEVHNVLGAGFLESVYQESMQIELENKGIPYKAQVELPLQYKGRPLARGFIADLLVFDEIIVELKAADQIIGPHEAQLINCLKATGKQVGLLINFGRPTLE